MIFVSYSWRDSVAARRVDAAFAALGREVWIDFRCLDVARDISQQLDTAIRDCSTFVVLRSRGQSSSPWMTAEHQMARQYNKRVHLLETDLILSLAADRLPELLAAVVAPPPSALLPGPPHEERGFRAEAR